MTPATKQQIKDSLAIIGFIAISFYLVYLNSCNHTEPIKVNTTESDSLKIANRDLKDIIAGLDQVISDQEKEIDAKKVQYIKGKDRIKYLEKTVTITDTIILEYTDAMKAQLLNCDTIIEIQGNQIDTLQVKIKAMNKVISNDSLLLSLSESKNKDLSETISKQNRKIKGLKIAAISAPIATILVILGLK